MIKGVVSCIIFTSFELVDFFCIISFSSIGYSNPNRNSGSGLEDIQANSLHSFTFRNNCTPHHVTGYERSTESFCDEEFGGILDDCLFAPITGTFVVSLLFVCFSFGVLNCDFFFPVQGAMEACDKKSNHFKQKQDVGMIKRFSKCHFVWFYRPASSSTRLEITQESETNKMKPTSALELTSIMDHLHSASLRQKLDIFSEAYLCMQAVSDIIYGIDLLFDRRPS